MVFLQQENNSSTSNKPYMSCRKTETMLVKYYNFLPWEKQEKGNTHMPYA